MQAWNTLVEQFSRVTDTLEMPIDPGIFEAVVALNALGIHTTQSCEGHLDRGTFAPWIEFEADEIQGLSRQLARVRQKYRSEHDEIIISEEETAIRQNAAIKQLATYSHVLSFLEAFYATRNTAYDSRLIIISPSAMRSRIINQGADFQRFLSLPQRQERLQAYQQEIQAFGAFLKNLYCTQTLQAIVS